MMTKEVINAINISLDAYSILISFIITCSILAYRDIEKHVKWFAFTNIAAIIYSISDIFMWISEGTDAAWKFVALPVSSFIFFLAGILLFMFYIKYIITYYSKITPIHKAYWIICLAASAVYIIMLIVTPFADWYYEILPGNIYHRGKLFNGTVAVEILLYCEALYIVIKNHNKLSNAENIGFTSFIFIPLIMQIVQIAHYGLALNSLGLTISFFIIYLNMNQKIKENLESVSKTIQQNELRNIELQHNTIINLSSLIETRDISESKHIIRVTNYVRMIAEKCKDDDVYAKTLTPSFISMLEKCAPLHDIGNIRIPDSILKHPGRVTPEEHAIIEKHTIEGSRIINEVLPVGIDRDMIKMANNICKNHHEKWNGRGYPDHLKGEDIPLCARIMAVADVFDALVTPRCYKKPVSYNEALEEMQKENGEHFDPAILDEFFKIKDKIIEINEKYTDQSYEGAN